MEDKTMSIKRTYILNTELTSTQLADAINERCNKLQAIISLCQADDFTDYSPEHIHNCLWLQGSLINELTELFETFSQKYLSNDSTTE